MGEEGSLFLLGLAAAWRLEHAFNALTPHAVLCSPLGSFWSNRAPYGLATFTAPKASAFVANALHRDRGSLGLVTILSSRRGKPTGEPDTNRASHRVRCDRRPYGSWPKAGSARELAGLGVLVAPSWHSHTSDDRRNYNSRLVNSRAWHCNSYFRVCRKVGVEKENGPPP